MLTVRTLEDSKIMAPKPAQMTFRARAKPYTSVRTSPKMYESGKKRFPALNLRSPSSGISLLDT